MKVLKKQIRCRVHDNVYDALKMFAVDVGMPVAAIVRIAVHQYLKKRGLLDA